MLRWASINRKLVTNLCATLVAAGGLALAGETKKPRQPIQRVAAEETVVETAAEAAPAEAPQKDDGADVFDAALDPDPWCAPGTFVGPRMPSQSEQLNSNSQNSLNQPQQNTQAQNNYDFSGGQNYLAAGASRNVPAFMGDFFGGGGALPVCMPGLADFTVSSETITFMVVDHFDANGRAIVSSEFGNKPDFNYISVDPVVDPVTHLVQPGAWNDDPGFDSFQVNNLTGAPIVDQVGALQYRVRLGGTAVLDDPGHIYPYNAVGDDNNITPVNGAAAGNAGYDRFSVTEKRALLNLEQVNLPLSTTVGRVKLSENSSPIPRDRIIVNYSLFQNVALAPNGVNVNRITPGFEKTLFSKNVSIEVRTPMAVTMDQSIQQGRAGFNQVEMGDVTATLKAIFLESDVGVVSVGLGMSLPTSDDISYRLRNGVETLRIDHRSVHLMPFIGGVWAPNDRWFGQWICQVDTATNGDPVLMNRDPNGLFLGQVTQGLSQTGVWTDPTFLYLDVNAGNWIYRDYESDSGLTGFALMAELHYNRSLQNFDTVSASLPGVVGKGFTIGRAGYQLEQLNYMLGGVAEFNRDNNVAFGYAVPVSRQHIFNGEFRVTYNHYFGRSSRRANPTGNRPPGLF